jgi:hypothetical protein
MVLGLLKSDETDPHTKKIIQNSCLHLLYARSIKP